MTSTANFARIFRLTFLAFACSVLWLPAQAQPDTGALSTAANAGGPTALNTPSTREFVNTLGMKFLPVPGTTVRFCLWETRRQDYEAYSKANPDMDRSWENAKFKGQPVSFAPSHPVVNVSWEDAKAFCAWLTEKEHREGRLPADASYRLPTDTEWSTAVGLPKEEGATPKERDRRIANAYPWGKQLPPPEGAGNYSDLSARVVFGPDWAFIPGYDDGFGTTAPVGSARANQHGLFDLGGNVWEWCEDFADGKSGPRVVRGGSWVNSDADYLLSSARNDRPPDFRRHGIGFRVVIAGGAGR